MVDVIERFVADVFNAHRLDVVDDYLSPEFVDHHPWGGFPGTRTGFAEGTAAFLAAFPDCTCTIVDTLVDGDRLATRTIIRGTDAGGFMGRPPTGRRVEFEAIDWYRIEGGAIREHWGLTDAQRMLAQLRDPGPGQAPD